MNFSYSTEAFSSDYVNTKDTPNGFLHNLFLNFFTKQTVIYTLSTFPKAESTYTQIVFIKSYKVALVRQENPAKKSEKYSV